MKYTKDKTITQSILKIGKTKLFLDSIVKKFVVFNKAKKKAILVLLKKTIYDGVNGIPKNILKLIHHLNKPENMNVDLGENFLI